MPTIPKEAENLNLTLRNHSEVADDDGAMDFAVAHREEADASGSEMFDCLSEEANQ
ncbi:MAG: hypothetical protein JKY48_16705 [Flavobacteriales bacterium]|nr:hypothetical protein [Flavobacteriales bacterium]